MIILLLPFIAFIWLLYETDWLRVNLRSWHVYIDKLSDLLPIYYTWEVLKLFTKSLKDSSNG